MSTLQIRDVPDDIKAILKSRAAAAGQSLSEYALAELRRAAEQPTLAELTARIRARGGPTPPLKPSAAEIIRAERDAR
jgi:antitoxin FitA